MCLQYVALLGLGLGLGLGLMLVECCGASHPVSPLQPCFLGRFRRFRSCSVYELGMEARPVSARIVSSVVFFPSIRGGKNEDLEAQAVEIFRAIADGYE